VATRILGSVAEAGTCTLGQVKDDVSSAAPRPLH